MEKSLLKSYWRRYIKSFQPITYPRFVQEYFPYTNWYPPLFRLKFLLNNIDKKEKILDAGCGSGWATVYLLKKGYKVFSVDLSLNSIRKTKRISSVTKAKSKIKRCDLTSLPFENNFFEVAFSFEVFEHIPDLDKALVELMRVIRPGGKLIVSIPNKYGAFSIMNDFIAESILKKHKHDSEIETKHVHLHSVYWWLKYFKKSKLYVEEVVNVEYLSPVLAKIVKNKSFFFSQVDVRIGTLLPKIFSSGWLFKITKK